VGFRIADAHPERVTAPIQNGVAHPEGLSDAWARRRHLAGISHPERIDPDTWADEFAFLTRPGMDRIQLDLMFDYRSNVEHPRHSWCGKAGAGFFTIASALAFAHEVPDAEIHLLNAGHFALDEEAEMHAGAWPERP
jgi:hypothetical protein